MAFRTGWRPRLGRLQTLLERYGDSTNAPGAFAPQQLGHASPGTPCVCLLSRAPTSFPQRGAKGRSGDLALPAPSYPGNK